MYEHLRAISSAKPTLLTIAMGQSCINQIRPRICRLVGTRQVDRIFSNLCSFLKCQISPVDRIFRLLQNAPQDRISIFCHFRNHEIHRKIELDSLKGSFFISFVINYFTNMFKNFQPFFTRIFHLDFLSAIVVHLKDHILCVNKKTS